MGPRLKTQEVEGEPRGDRSRSEPGDHPADDGHANDHGEWQPGRAHGDGRHWSRVPIALTADAQAALIELVVDPTGVRPVSARADKAAVAQAGEVHRDVVLPLAECRRHLAYAMRPVGEDPQDPCRVDSPISAAAATASSTLGAARLGRSSGSIGSSRWFVDIFNLDCVNERLRASRAVGHLSGGHTSASAGGEGRWAIAEPTAEGHTESRWPRSSSTSSAMRMPAIRRSGVATTTSGRCRGKGASRPSGSVGCWPDTAFATDAIISSPKARARQTAELVAARLGREVVIDDRLGRPLSPQTVEALIRDARQPGPAGARGSRSRLQRAAGPARRGPPSCRCARARSRGWTSFARSRSATASCAGCCHPSWCRPTAAELGSGTLARREDRSPRRSVAGGDRERERDRVAGRPAPTVASKRSSPRSRGVDQLAASRASRRSVATRATAGPHIIP